MGIKSSVNVIISNGAFKSGSTWLFNILKELTGFDEPENQFLNANWVNVSIHPDRLTDFLEYYSKSSKTAIAKNHFSKAIQRDEIMNYPNVVVFNIDRDPRDLVVSAYHHGVNKENLQEDFQNYYWKRGRIALLNVYKFHNLWDINHLQVYKTSYERLLSDFENELERMAEFLKVDVSKERIAAICDRTSLSQLRKRYNDKENFFRKGVKGDWINYLDKKMEDDVQYIFDRGKLRESSMTKLKKNAKMIIGEIKKLKS